MKEILYLMTALLALSAARAEPRNPLDVLQLKSLTETLERPLFQPSRRPPAPTSVATPEREPPAFDGRPVALGPPPFELVGAVVGKDIAIALVRNKTTSEIVRLRQGDDAEGWRVVTIESQTVTLEGYGSTHSIALFQLPTTPAEVAGLKNADPPADR
jgi:general secretion pathway protein N